MFYYPFNWGCLYPSQITSPLVYTEDMSIAQQIAHLFGYMKRYENGLNNYLTIEAFKKFLEWLEKEEAAQNDEMRGYTDNKIAALKTWTKKQIEAITAGALQWNVQDGQYTPSKQAQRDMFNDVTVHAYTVDEWAEYSALTVDQLANSGYNVAGWAVVNCLIIGDDVNEGYYMIGD